MGTFDKKNPNLDFVLARRRSNVEEFLASENITDEASLLKWVDEAKNTWDISQAFCDEAKLLLSSRQGSKPSVEVVKRIVEENVDPGPKETVEADLPATLAVKQTKRSRQQKINDE